MADNNEYAYGRGSKKMPLTQAGVTIQEAANILDTLSDKDADDKKSMHPAELGRALRRILERQYLSDVKDQILVGDSDQNQDRNKTVDEVAQASLDRIKSDEGAAARARRDFALAEMLAFADDLATQHAAGKMTAGTAVSIVAGFRAAIVRLGLVTEEDIEAHQALEEQKLQQEFGDSFDVKNQGKILEHTDEIKAAAIRRLAEEQRKRDGL